VLRVTLLIVCLLATGAWAAIAQGTIEGAVIEADGGDPIPGVNIVIEELDLGAATGPDGRYAIEQVPAGTHLVTARFIGYRTETRSIDLSTGDTATLDFRLEEEALGLDELVVTGEAGQARRKEVGNAISQINPAEIQKPSLDMEGVLQGEVTGMIMSQASGMAGSGSYIRLRGNSSVTQGNQPLVYIDGVRVRSEGYAKNVPPVGYSGRSGNVAASPLNDINPNDIERVEVIKGAAATTLYGTEASAGVIQIFTKQGGENTTRWTMQVDQSFDRVLPFGTEEVPYVYIDPWLRSSHGQRYSLSGRGSTDNVSFYLSGNFGDDKAPLPNDREQKYGLRGNLEFQATSDLIVQWNTSLSQRDVSNTAAGDNAQGLVLNAYRQETNYVGTSEASRTFKEEIDRLLEYDINSSITHLTTGVTLRFAPSEQHDQRLTLGYDRAFQENRQVRPFGFILAQEGKMSNQRWDNQLFTVDYASSYAVDLSSAIATTVSAGGQIVAEDTRSTTGYAEDFPGPGEPTLSSGALSLSFEERIREINAGVFAQNRLGFGDRLFLTTGLRVDGNSAFGESLGLQLYPKVSASYVLSDEPFWNENWGTLKLRAAYGHAGRAPGAFDAVRTWQPTQLGNQPGFLPGNLGNSELGPERTEEFETGFDASIFNDRVSTTFTYYRQVTRDALFPVRQVPSNGAWSNQLENVGKIRNSGVELDVNGSILRGPSLSWDMGASLTTNFSKALDLGKATSFQVGGAAYIEEGYPIPVLRGPKVQNPNEVADPVYEEHRFGPNLPTHTVRLNTRVEFLGGIVFRALGEFMGGNYIQDTNTEGKISRGQRSWPTCLGTFDQAEQEGLQSLTALQRSRCLATQMAFDSFIHPADFFKLRLLSLQLPLGRFVPRVDRPTLTLSARNALRWFNDDWPILDPEIGSNVGHKSFVIEPQEHIPPPATFSASLQFSF